MKKIDFEIPEEGNPKTEWFYAPIKNSNNYTKAAARTLTRKASGLEASYVCIVCDTKEKATGGGGWFTESEVIDHIIENHPEAVRAVSRATSAIAKTYAPQESRHPFSSSYPKPGDVGYDLLC